MTETIEDQWVNCRDTNASIEPQEEKYYDRGINTIQMNVKVLVQLLMEDTIPANPNVDEISWSMVTFYVFSR